MFAEDIRLLPEGLFSEILRSTKDKPERFSAYLAGLFQAMATGGDSLLRDIPHFNGNLFDSAVVIDLTADELHRVAAVADLDWSAIDPSIFGTLFVRGMDPALRSQLGAEYTSRSDIETLVEPVVMAPLRREWATVRAAVEGRVPQDGCSMAPLKLRKAKLEATLLIRRFLDRLAAVKILDPACGSGNFLYVVLQKLKNLEKEAILLAQDRIQESFLPVVGPWQLYGLEVNPYAHDLAQMTVWIGYLQWTRANGFGVQQKPILKPLAGNFRCMDAIVDQSDPEHPCEPEWPEVDFIVGNPPFLGDKTMRRQLGDTYVERLRALYEDRIPGQSDLCCYWFEKARAHIEHGDCLRAGLLATQNIRGGASRSVVDRITASGSIFFAISDREWILDGANVNISMVGFDDGTETARSLDGSPVQYVNANLSAGCDVTTARTLPLNRGIAFIGSCKGGSFDLPEGEAISLLNEGGNPTGRPNSDVLRPVANSSDVVGIAGRRWIIDTADMDLSQVCMYEGPYSLVGERVKPDRDTNRDSWLRQNWWRPQRMRPGMRKSIAGMLRFAVTPTTSKHRIFAWLSAPVLPDHKLVVVARCDDFAFGLLQCRLHETWALRLGTRLQTRPNYNNTTCFETFPFPWAPGHEPVADPLVVEIGAAAAELCRLRDTWLNPPEWVREEVLEFAATAGGPWDRFIVNPRLPTGAPAELHEPDTTAIEFALAEHAVALARREAAAKRPVRPGEVGVARYPRLVPRSAQCAEVLAKRTLTSLYNQRPTWLDLAHRRLDEAVCAAYRSARGGDWAADMPAEKILEQLLALNLADAQAAAGHG